MRTEVHSRQWHYYHQQQRDKDVSIVSARAELIDEETHPHGNAEPAVATGVAVLDGAVYADAGDGLGCPEGAGVGVVGF